MFSRGSETPISNVDRRLAGSLDSEEEQLYVYQQGTYAERDHVYDPGGDLTCDTGVCSFPELSECGGCSKTVRGSGDACDDLCFRGSGAGRGLQDRAGQILSVYVCGDLPQRTGACHDQCDPVCRGICVTIVTLPAGSVWPGKEKGG